MNLALLLLCISVAILHGQTLDRRFLPSKTWWAKKVTDDIYTAGRLTERQYKYASEVGFKTILSNFNFTSTEYIGKEVLPPSYRAKQIVTNLSGIHFKVVLRRDQSWSTLDAIQSLSRALEGAPRPILYHCRSSTSATFMLLSHLANVSRHHPNTSPRINSTEFYNRAAALGKDYTRHDLMKVVSSITGEPIVQNPQKPEEYGSGTMWLTKPLAKNWFVGGQYQSNYIQKIKSSGIKTIVNARKGILTKNTPSQEEVNLLNIKDKTGTYEHGGRQSKARLEQTRINASKPNEYISKISTVNYEARNFLEFGDEIGYNETNENLAAKTANLTYYHMPFGGSYGNTLKLYHTYRPRLLEATRRGPVLVHCGSGFRAVVLAALAAGDQHGKSSGWALRRCWDHGYEISESTHADIVKLFKDVLDTPFNQTLMDLSTLGIYTTAMGSLDSSMSSYVAAGTTEPDKRSSSAPGLVASLIYISTFQIMLLKLCTLS